MLGAAVARGTTRWPECDSCHVECIRAAAAWRETASSGCTCGARARVLALSRSRFQCTYDGVGMMLDGPFPRIRAGVRAPAEAGGPGASCTLRQLWHLQRWALYQSRLQPPLQAAVKLFNCLAPGCAGDRLATRPRAAPALVVNAAGGVSPCSLAPTTEQGHRVADAQSEIHLSFMWGSLFCVLGLPAELERAPQLQLRLRERGTGPVCRTTASCSFRHT
jgi:hypothetical protein